MSKELKTNKILCLHVSCRALYKLLEPKKQDLNDSVFYGNVNNHFLLKGAWFSLINWKGWTGHLNFTCLIKFWGKVTWILPFVPSGLRIWALPPLFWGSFLLQLFSFPSLSFSHFPGEKYLKFLLLLFFLNLFLSLLCCWHLFSPISKHAWCAELRTVALNNPFHPIQNFLVNSCLAVYRQHNRWPFHWLTYWVSEIPFDIKEQS